MEEVPDRREWLYLPPALAARTQFYRQADRSVIGTIRRGILFVMAFWSGPARMAFAELKRVLERHDTAGRLELVVVDTEGCPDLYDAPEFAGKLHGWGEAAWVWDGQILRTSGMGHHPECFEPFTRQLLEKARADV
jgi:hypothetical protein